MQLPFTASEFLGVFRAYNHAIGIAPLLLIAIALATVFTAVARAPSRRRLALAGAGLLWLWAGAVYHWTFFARINPAAWVFGAAFLLQGIALIVAAARGHTDMHPRRDGWSGAGWVLVLYAIAVYPLASLLQGHGYPDGPSFGAPCPVTIFTMGVLLWARPMSGWLLFVPAAWAVVGTSAAMQLGMLEDLALPVAAAVVVAAFVRQATSGVRGKSAIVRVPSN